MQPVSSRIWTRVAVSISYDDNDYTTGTSKRNERVNLGRNGVKLKIGDPVYHKKHQRDGKLDKNDPLIIG